jgi:hypothetical protein
MWHKIKRIYTGYAQLPTVIEHLGYLRIFYSYRINGKSVINYFEIDPLSLKITYENKRPVFNIGEKGCFDDSGVMPSCIISDLLYYTGWNINKGNVPYGHGIGIAKFNYKLNKFERMSKGPVLDRNENIPYLANSPFVKNNKMYFCNGTGWHKDMPLYNICIAMYKKSWIVKEKITGGDKEACSRPFLEKNFLYFSKKNFTKNYEIFKYNIATKKTNKVLSKSKKGWDSEMVCYPWITNDIMFYNGNNYGETGIGIAKWSI